MKNDIDQLKRSAKALARETNISHQTALNIFAKRAGFSHWGSYLSHIDKPSIISKALPASARIIHDAYHELCVEYPLVSALSRLKTLIDFMTGYIRAPDPEAVALQVAAKLDIFDSTAKAKEAYELATRDYEMSLTQSRFRIVSWLPIEAKLLAEGQSPEQIAIAKAEYLFPVEDHDNFHMWYMDTIDAEEDNGVFDAPTFLAQPFQIAKACNLGHESRSLFAHLVMNLHESLEEY